MPNTEFLYVNYVLNTQPGRIPPTVKIKEGSNAALLRFYIRTINPDYPDDEITLETSGCAIFKATLPNGYEVFLTQAPTIETDHILVSLSGSDLENFTRVPGSFKGTISIIDQAWSASITRENYEEFDLVTVQPFFMEIRETAYGHYNLEGSVQETAELYLETEDSEV